MLLQGPYGGFTSHCGSNMEENTCKQIFDALTKEDSIKYQCYAFLSPPEILLFLFGGHMIQPQLEMGC